MPRLTALSVSLLGLLPIYAALAATAADVVQARKASYRQLGAAFKAVNDQLRSGAPQLQPIQAAARQIQLAAKSQYGWFPRGSGPESGVKTAAKPVIWQKPADFRAAQNAFATQAAGFAQAAAGGDMGSIRLQARQVAQTCGACHRAFREESE